MGNGGITLRGPVVSIGECMVELARGGHGRFELGFGGDTFNTAVYLARAGVAVSYASALGDDPYSAGIVALAQREGVGTELLARLPGRMPGLYLIETAADGERTFHYWRDRAPAREAMDGPAGDAIAAAMSKAGLVYFSAITLSLYAEPGLRRLADAARTARAAGTTIVMDGNYRPRGWQDDAQRARDVIGRFWPLADVALPTLDDEARLWGDADASATIARLRGCGVREVAVKLGAGGACVTQDEAAGTMVPAPQPVDALDTTGAGDSFNAAYLAARVHGEPPQTAAMAGHRLAAIVIQHRGAIVPRDATQGAFTRAGAAKRPDGPAP